MKYIAKEGEPLLEALKQLAPESSKTTLKQWIKEGRVLINGSPAANGSVTLAAGQTVTLGVKRRYLEGGLNVLFEDADLIVVEKPEGLLSVATNFEKGETAHAVLKRHFKPHPVYVVHRLDQETSGVMMFAKTENAFSLLKDLFINHDLVREYVAIVEGRVKTSQGTWDCYVYEDGNYKVHETQDTQKGQRAITHYTTETTTRAYSKIKLTLETGRKNQIRVHCQLAGHPIVGDRKYGAKSNPIRRLALHAERLEFVHPITHKKLTFVSPPPEEFERLVTG